MPTEINRGQDAENDAKMEAGDAPIPRASDDEVLDDTARLAREGQRELEKDPREPPSRKSDTAE